MGAREGEERILERNQSKRALAECVRGDFYFHPTDEDLSAGAPDRKKPLGVVLPGYSYSGFAVVAQVTRNFVSSTPIRTWM